MSITSPHDQLSNFGVQRKLRRIDIIWDPLISNEVFGAYFDSRFPSGKSLQQSQVIRDRLNGRRVHRS